jgi:hypothetical protein
VPSIPPPVRTTGGGLTWLAADHHNTGSYAIDATTLDVTERRLDPYGNPADLPPAGYGPTTRGSSARRPTPPG